MNDPQLLPLLAQNDGHEAPHQEGHEGVDTATANLPSGKIFNKVLSSLGDHHEITIGNAEILALPHIIVDGGVHFYENEHAMEEGGLFKMDMKHHTVRVVDGKPPALDMSVTSLVFFQWVSIALLLAALIPMGRRYKKAGIRPPRGLFNVLELVVVWVRDDMVKANIGKGWEKLTPIFLSFFFFILTMNVVGLIPGGHTATGSLNTTAALAGMAFLLIQAKSIQAMGLWGWVKHLTGGTPVYIWPIMIPVEIMGLFTKPFALCIRLFANMSAGHVVLLSLIGLVFVAKAFIPVTIAFSVFIYTLELLVVLLQAYIFTVLTAVFTGMGMAHGHHDDHAAAAAH